LRDRISEAKLSPAAARGGVDAGLQRAVLRSRDQDADDQPRRSKPAGLIAPAARQAEATATSRDHAPASAAKGSWAVQVGVFSDRSNARKVAEQAAALIPGLPASAVVGVTTTQLSGKELFRARVSGMTKDAAEQACKALTRKSKACIALEA
jgi:D-alanyl-D-alanine carboxypeptidase